MVSRIASWIAALTGWRAALAALMLGGVAALALPPLGLSFAMIPAYTGLVWLIDGCACSDAPRLRRAALIGWSFGLGFFLPGLAWIGEAFLVEAEVFAWMRPFAMVLLPAGLALFWALAAVIAARFWPAGAWRVVWLAVVWTAAEWLRGHVLTGFPWNLPVAAIASSLALMQVVAVVGSYGASLLVLWVAASPATLTDPHGPSAWRRWGTPVLAAVILVGWFVGGAVRLALAPEAFDETTRVRIVQANVDQKIKWSPENRERIIATYLTLSAQPAPAGAPEPTLIVWPESAIPVHVDRADAVRAEIAGMLGPERHLITGSQRVARLPDGRARHFNSIMALDGRGAVVDVYDKNHLVPFGEYLPLPGLLSAIGLRQLTEARGAFTPGAHRMPLHVNGLPPALPLICYEIIFPGALTRAEDVRWIVNVTNDAWFGDSAGPYQHLALARLRAIEEGLPVIRAANTGISAVIDPVGRLVAEIPYGRQGILDADLPMIRSAPIYARIDDTLYFLVTLTLAICANLLGRNRNF